MIRLSSVVTDSSSSDLSENSELLGYTKGKYARILKVKDMSLLAEFQFPEDVFQIKISEDALKFFVLNK